jgi:N-acyl-D-aspartate/D-glutamate deacylase
LKSDTAAGVTPTELWETTMTYDLLIRDGRIVDGTGMPAYLGNVAVRNCKIVAIGKLSGTAKRQPGMVADIVIFDPGTVRPLPHEVVHDFPTGAMRIRELAEGVHRLSSTAKCCWKTASTPVRFLAAFYATPTIN